MKTQNMKRKRLLRKYHTEEENLDQVIEELNQKVSANMQQFSDAGKDYTLTINIKYLEQTARNFTAFSDKKIPKRKLHQLKKK